MKSLEVKADPNTIEECVRKKLLRILEDSGFGEVVIEIERIKLDRVAITIRSGSSERFVLMIATLFTYLEQSS